MYLKLSSVSVRKIYTSFQNTNYNKIKNIRYMKIK